MIKSKTFVLISLLLFLIKFPVFSDEKSADKSAETEETIVFIESAKKTEYKKIEEEEVVIFTGDVKLSVSKPSQEIYIEAEDKYLKDGKVLPALSVICSIMAHILGYDGDKDRIEDYQTICDICATQVAKHIDFWKMLESKIDYIWTK